MRADEEIDDCLEEFEKNFGIPATEIKEIVDIVKDKHGFWFSVYPEHIMNILENRGYTSKLNEEEYRNLDELMTKYAEALKDKEIDEIISEIAKILIRHGMNYYQRGYSEILDNVAYDLEEYEVITES